MWCISVFRCSNIIKTEKYFHCYLISGLSGRSIQLMVGALPLAGSASWSSLMFNITNNIPVPPKFFRWCCLYPLKAFMYKSLQCGSPSLCYYLNSGFSLGSLRKTSSLIFVICILCISPTWMFWGYNMNEHNCLFEEKIASSVKKNLLTPEANIMSLAFWSLDKLHLVNRVVVRMSHSCSDKTLSRDKKSNHRSTTPRVSEKSRSSVKLPVNMNIHLSTLLCPQINRETWNPRSYK